MTDTETANEIGERIGPKVLPIDPLEFQRMIHDDNSIKEPKGLMGEVDEYASSSYGTELFDGRLLFL